MSSAEGRDNLLMRRPWLGPVLLSALLALLLYGHTVGYEFVYDDVGVIVQDDRLEQPGFIWRLWLAPWWAEGSAAPASRPVTTLTFWLQTQLHGKKPPFFHAANVLLYMILCAQVAWLAWAWTANAWAAGCAGALFAVHPIHVEIAANVVGRAEILAAIFALLALQGWWCWRQDLTWKRAALLGGAILFAGLSKEHGYFMAPAIVLMEWGMRRFEQASWREAWPAVGRFVTVVAFVALLAGIQMGAMRYRHGLYAPVAEMDNPMHRAAVAERMVTPLKLTGKAVQMLAAPIEQSPDYSPTMLMPTADLRDPLVLLGIFSAVAWGGGMVWAWRTRHRMLGILAVLPVFWLIPSNTILLIGTIFAERLLTMLSIFVVLAVAVGIPPTVWASRMRWAGAGVTAVLVMLGAWQTLLYSAWWQDSARLHVATVQHHPESGRFQGFLARELLVRGLEYPEQRDYFFKHAGDHARLALEYWPRQYMSYEVLAYLAHDRGDEAEALRLARQARRINMKSGLGDYLLESMGLQASRQEVEEKLESIKRQVQESPDDRAAQRELAEAYLVLKKYPEAVELYEKIVSADVTDKALLNHYIDSLLGAFQYAEALRWTQRLMELEPGRWSHLNDAAVLAIMSKSHLPEAKRWLDEAMALSPGSPEPWVTLGDWWALQNDKANAIEAYRQAWLRAKPGGPVRAHCALLLKRLGASPPKR